MEKLMVKFITRYYPVTRHKINHRFKRSILFDDGKIYQLSDKKEMDQAYNRIISVLKIVFNCSEETCKLVLKKVL